MLNWREIPSVRILIPFLLGIVLAVSFPVGAFPLLLFPLLGVLLLLISLKKKDTQRTIFGILFSLFLFAAGYQHTYLHNELRQDTHFKNHLHPQDTLVAWITDMPTPKNWISARLALEKLHHCPDCTGNLLVYFEKDSLSSRLQYGDRIAFSAKIDTIEAPKNPNAFNYQRYLHFKNLHYQAFVRTDDWMLLEEKSGWLFWRKIYQLRVHFLAILKQHLKDEESLAVGAALILGYRANLSNELRDAYADTGAIHVLAVSGLHVGLIYLFLKWLLKFIPTTNYTRYLKILLSLLCIWLFAFLTGSSPSVLRAATMFSFVTFSDYSRRFKNIYNSLAAAALVSLLYDPFLLCHVGFQLSYMAVLGIVYFQPKMVSHFDLSSKIGNYFLGLVAVSFAAQLAVSPLSVYYFHQFPVWFWLSSMLVIPAAFAILLLGVLIFLTTPVVPIFADLFGGLLNALIGWVNTAIYAIQELPLGLIKGLWIDGKELVLLYIMLAFIVFWINTKKARWMLTPLAVLLLFCLSYSGRSLKQLHQKEMVVYNIRKQSLIDFFDGKACYTLQTTTLEVSDEDFAAQQHRWANGISQRQNFHLEQDTLIREKNWFYDSPFIQFHDKRLALIQHANFKPMDTLLRVDYLLLQNNPSLSILDLQQVFDFEIVLFDASNYRKQCKAWTAECIELGVEYYDIGKSGAWIKTSIYTH